MRDEIRHTPGPWRLNDRLHAHVLSDNYHVIDAGRGFHKDGQFGKGFSVAAFMSISDARLIAAAPELLEALKELLAAELAIYPSAEAGKEAQDAWADRRAAARNNASFVIAKARGSQS